MEVEESKFSLAPPTCDEAVPPPSPVLDNEEDAAPDTAVSPHVGDCSAEVDNGAVGNKSGANVEAEVGLAFEKKRERPTEQPEELNGEFLVSPDLSSSYNRLVPKRGRGRPRGSGKLQMLACLGGLIVDTAGSKFIPHAMTVQTGEDVAQKFFSVSQKGPRSICILSAVGAISRADIRQPGASGGILRYEGRFEILTLSGSHAYCETGSLRRKSGMLTVSLANTDGQVFGGAIAGSLIAAGPIQLIIASFKQKRKNGSKLNYSAADSMMTNGILFNSNAAAVTEEDNQAHTSPVPATTIEGIGNLVNGQTANGISFQNVVWNGSQPSEADPMSEHSTSDG